MIRAVLDANVIVSAFLQSKGPSGRIVRSFLEERSFELVVSTAILDEIRHSLRYPRVRRRLSLLNSEIETRVASLGLLADVVPGEVEVKVVRDDPDDDKYFAAALEGRASFVVSGDRHLRDVKEHQAVRVVTPREFVGLLEGQK